MRKHMNRLMRGRTIQGLALSQLGPSDEFWFLSGPPSPGGLRGVPPVEGVAEVGVPDHRLAILAEEK
jgi:hypothetical protein